MVAKRWKFERVLPSLTIAFGVVTFGSGWMTNYASLAACFRVSLFLLRTGTKEKNPPFEWLFCLIDENLQSSPLELVNTNEETASSAFAGAFGGLVAFGIPGWRWIYIIEGSLTIAFGFMSFWLVPTSFETAWFLDENDKVAMRRRAEAMHQYRGGQGHFGSNHASWAAKDIKAWLHVCLQFCVITPLYGEIIAFSWIMTDCLIVPEFNNFLPIIIEDGLEFSGA
ncbi:hypothetical protein N7490_004623 [Penicillium lividum]|nr:hypothetical protein N7490_004623 [Penicillium lividum]